MVLEIQENLLVLITHGLDISGTLVVALTWIEPIVLTKITFFCRMCAEQFEGWIYVSLNKNIAPVGEMLESFLS